MPSEPAPFSPPAPGAACPCGSGKTFEQCCQPVLLGSQIPATAEELMRSRFTAHVARDYRYLHRTYAGTASTPYKEEVEEGTAVTWTRLVVHAHELGKSPDSAFVDFSAYFNEQGGEGVLHEKAEFERRQGQWIYTRAVRMGPAPVRNAAPKAGRNDPCPCGSGKKYKHCCLK